MKQGQRFMKKRQEKNITKKVGKNFFKEKKDNKNFKVTVHPSNHLNQQQQIFCHYQVFQIQNNLL